MERVRGEVLALPQRERMLPAVVRGRPGDDPPGGVKGDVGSQPSDNSQATRLISRARVCAQGHEHLSVWIGHERSRQYPDDLVRFVPQPEALSQDVARTKMALPEALADHDDPWPLCDIFLTLKRPSPCERHAENREELRRDAKCTHWLDTAVGRQGDCGGAILVCAQCVEGTDRLVVPEPKLRPRGQRVHFDR